MEAINLLIKYSGDIENFINSPSLLQVTYKLYKCMESEDITVVIGTPFACIYRELFLIWLSIVETGKLSRS